MPKPTPTPRTITLPSDPDFQNAIDLLAVYSDASNQLEELQARTNGELLELLDDKKKEYAKLQDIMAKAESALETLVLKHPDWFREDKRSIRTPYGTLKLHASSKLSVKNEEVSILLIEQALKQQATAAAADPNYKPPFDASLLLRTTTVLNLEALENLDDATLKSFRIERVTRDNFSVIPAKLDMGKAVADASKQQQRAA